MCAQARGSRWVSGDGDGDDAGADDLQTVMWTRALAGLDRHNVEGCEDLLDTYFTQASKCTSQLWMHLPIMDALRHETHALSVQGFAGDTPSQPSMRYLDSDE